MLLDPRDLISRVLLETGEWEPDTWNAIAAHLKPGGTFVDVGAHVGHFSLMAATAVGPTGRVAAIEANPEMADRLQENIKASKAAVTVQAVACADFDKALDFFVAADANTGSSSICAANASLYGNSQKRYRVQARRLDAILEGLGISRVDVLKIDVEGAELRVLRGAKETLTRCRPVVIIELDEHLLNTMGTGSAEVHNLLLFYGYSSDGIFDHANVRYVPSV
jgi:FkbM family methyltransferase